MKLKPAILLAIMLWMPRPAAAQDPLGWNGQRALDLIARARERRELPRGDSTLRNYQSKASGFVYFYLDRPGSEERTLVRVDQIAIDLFFKRPNLTKQRIVGMRDANRLPNKMYYHLDHLTVVQNGLGDVIKIGDGDEVRDVPHPAAPGADSVYDYRLADSVTLQLGGDQPSVRVYEIQVRPKRMNRAAFIGSLYVDRAEADIVRLTFTFTPASYVDRRLDYINISLDNGLFGGKYWLPNEQSVEIRRQIPELDFAAGSVIKGRIHVANYEFNANIPDSVFFGRPVTAASEEERKSFAFPQDIYSELNTEGLAPPPQMEDLRARAMALVREKRLSGLPPLRIYVPNASSVLRRNNTEGWYAGSGLTYVTTPQSRFDVLAGYAFKAKKPEVSAAFKNSDATTSITLGAFLNRSHEISPVEIAPGVLNTLSVTVGNADYSDLYFASGAEVLWATNVRPEFRVEFGGRAEEQRSGLGEIPTLFTQLPTNGRAREVYAGLARPKTPVSNVSWGGHARARAIWFDAQNPQRDEQDFLRYGGFIRTEASLQLAVGLESAPRNAHVRFDVARNFGRTPAQYHFFVGGRETLPGYELREFVDSANFAVARFDVSQNLTYPWIRLHALGYAALTHTFGDNVVGDIVFTVNQNRMRGSAGLGVGLFWDILRVDVVKGARWQTLLSVRPDLWDLL
ncbi:MAG TPA: hypothetical protein VM100_08295 [Longimicrobiales bacterium]|nr:hypothetical protein [Longimicrobiales bacterium]